MYFVSYKSAITKFATPQFILEGKTHKLHQQRMLSTYWQCVVLYVLSHGEGMKSFKSSFHLQDCSLLSAYVSL